MLIYQIIFIPISLIALIAILIRQKEGRSSLLSFLLSLLAVLIVLLLCIFPDITTNIANIFGIRRGLDFIFILGVLGCYILIYKMYIMLDNLENELTDLVRKIALKDEYNEQDDD